MIFRRRRVVGAVQASAPGSIAAGRNVVNPRTEIHYHYDSGSTSAFSGLRVPVDGATSSVLHELRQTIKVQLLEEVAVQELSDPPLKVTWKRYEGNVLALPGTPVIPERGGLDDIASLFAELPRKRMVVLGPAGAGKTTAVTLLTLKILQDASPETQVPVIFPLSSWNLGKESLHDWIARTLRDLYAVVHSEKSALSLTRRRHIIPVLDGLDELPWSLVPQAVTAINQAFAGADPFILTCRTDDLEAAGARGRSLISADAALELAPVERGAALEFVAANATEAHKKAWDRVGLALADTADSHPMTPILQRPLTIWLARAAFRGEQVLPEDFLDRARFPDTAAIEGFLVDAMVPALLNRARRVTQGLRRPFRTLPSARRTREVLAFLAVVMTNHGGRRFAWWTLPGHIAPRERKSMVSWLVISPAILLSALTIPVAFLMGSSVTSVLLVLGMLTVMVGGQVLVARYHASLGTSIVDSFSDFTWIPVAGIEYTPKPAPRLVDQDARRSVRAERRRAMLRARPPQSFYLMVFASLVFFRSMGELLPALPFLILLGGTHVLTSIPPTSHPNRAKTSWGPYLMSRLWLAFRGVLPFRLVPFLEKMRYAGLLRPVGATYEFRNVELQKALARTPGARLEPRLEVVPPLVLTGAELHVGAVKSLIGKCVTVQATAPRSLSHALAGTAAIYAGAALAGSEDVPAAIVRLASAFEADTPETVDTSLPHTSVLAAFPHQHLPHSPAELRRAESDHLRFDLDDAVAAYTALAETLRARRGRQDVSVARLVFRTSLVLVDRCQDGDFGDFLRAQESLAESADLLARAVGADHAETLSVLVVQFVLDGWFMGRVPYERWRGLQDGQEISLDDPD
ncbi:NACHT domain-containing protein [Nonomuraea sp. NPDC049480]|uniref:NACHT domain-containing protein n=1 Tax=Nonomuraea sp. NPDC049480 TaxID=3364353 RepID=UPI003797369A